MNQNELNEILEKHQKWLNGEEGGERVCLRCTDLRYTNLSAANLYEANLREANLSGANLSGADLREAYLREANLSGADLSGADLRGADLRYANLSNVKANEYTSGYWLVCPEKGAFIGYKKADGCIVELQIAENAKRSSATTRKCRCSEAKVLSITNLDGTASSITSVPSDRDEDFIYEVGKTVRVENFDNNRWNECSTGIHFFITREEAVIYD